MFAFIRLLALSLPLETQRWPNFVYNNMIRKKSHKRCHFKEITIVVHMTVRFCNIILTCDMFHSYGNPIILFSSRTQSISFNKFELWFRSSIIPLQFLDELFFSCCNLIFGMWNTIPYISICQINVD
jgi:hypothetical protein